MTLVVASLVRNEADRYLGSALQAWSEFADHTFVLDDDSDDETRSILAHAPNTSFIRRYAERKAWGAESAARRELWDYVMSETRSGDYIMWLDADMVPISDPRELFRNDVDSYFFAHYDLWGEDAYGRPLYREDRFWTAHHRPRCWAIRRPKRFDAEWLERGLHCGHLPANWTPERAVFAPGSYSLLHYGYAEESERFDKAAAYLRNAAQLTEQEREHARSIVDAEPALKPLLMKPTWKLTKPAETANITR